MSAAYDNQRRNELAREKLALLDIDPGTTAPYSIYRRLPAELREASTRAQVELSGGSSRMASARAGIAGRSRRQVIDTPAGRVVSTLRADVIVNQLRRTGAGYITMDVTMVARNGRARTVSVWGKGGWQADRALARLLQLGNGDVLAGIRQTIEDDSEPGTSGGAPWMIGAVMASVDITVPNLRLRGRR